jgi:hypothetical protein
MRTWRRPTFDTPKWTTVPELLAVLDMYARWRAEGADDAEMTARMCDRWPAWGRKFAARDDDEETE